MFILFVYLVCMNLVIIRTQENIFIYINATDNLEGPRKCNVLSEVTLVNGSYVSLEVRSDYFIKVSNWIQYHMKHRHQFHHRFHHLNNSNFSITYERSISSNNEKTNNFTYKYSHTHKVVGLHSGATWIFTFELLRNYDPWTSNDQNEDVETWSCQTSVQSLDTLKNEETLPTGIQSLDDAESSPVSRESWLIIFVSLFGILLLVQTSVILYGKARSRKSKKNNGEDAISPKSPKTKRGAKPRRNIADRPPLPLPDDVVNEDKFKMEPNQSPMSHVQKRHHLFPPASAPPMPVVNPYNNDNSGPLVPKQSQTKKPFNNSEEELRTHGFARRQIEAKLTELPPKPIPASKSFKVPKPLPRAPPSPLPDKAPAFQPAHRKEPAPPLHPKNMPIFPPAAPCRQTETRLSDVDWQYEALEPASKYLNNFSDTPYDNM